MNMEPVKYSRLIMQAHDADANERAAQARQRFTRVRNAGTPGTAALPGSN